MLCVAGTDWFFLLWRLLPLPTPHMVKSACSSSAAVLCAFSVFVGYAYAQDITMGGGKDRKRKNSSKQF